MPLKTTVALLALATAAVGVWLTRPAAPPQTTLDSPIRRPMRTGPRTLAPPTKPDREAALTPDRPPTSARPPPS
ncbi:MAG: hypothetical protein AB1Z98_37755 [Nannocystaceae bacterium]